MLIHPFDHEDILVGQGTVGLEILEQCPDVKTILVPVGGGGLAAGIALLRTERPDIRIIGVQAEDAAAYPASLTAGHPIASVMGATMADGISVAEPGGIPFEVIADLLDDVITVSEESMSRALISLLERAKMLVEPAGAAGVAAILEKPDAFEGPVVSVLSGGNIDALVLLDVIRHGLAAAGRFLLFRARISDRPGALMGLLTRSRRDAGQRPQRQPRPRVGVARRTPGRRRHAGGDARTAAPRRGQEAPDRARLRARLTSLSTSSRTAGASAG